MYIFTDDIYKEGERLINFNNFDSIGVYSAAVDTLHKCWRIKPDVLDLSISSVYVLAATRLLEDGYEWEILAVSDCEETLYKLNEALNVDIKKRLSIGVTDGAGVEPWISISRLKAML